MAIMDQAADIVEKGGIEAWSRVTVEDILNQPADDAASYTKSTDILEVWFDSGSTFQHVLRGSHKDAYNFGVNHRAPFHASPDNSTPEADLYLEGHDQHRGWFHSSLLLGCALYDRAPYKGLLTHGFATDGQGRKMSKSLGNTVAPQEVSDKMGAEIVRLWVASTDYSGDLNIDDKILARVVDAYRRIRNTLRFLLANVSDFDPAKDAVAFDDLLEIDKYALSRAAQVQDEILGAYNPVTGVFEGGHFGKYEFHPVVSKLQLYCSEDLGAFYLDVLKDRLYTTAPKSLARRSAQTALHQITHAMLRWMAPFLSFTAEEAWTTFGKSESIFLEMFTQFDNIPASITDKWENSFADKWGNIKEIRAFANKKIEDKRTEGLVGASLQAELIIHCDDATYDTLASLGDDLKFVFITSKVSLVKVAGAGLTVEVKASEATKCERCWHYSDDVGHNPAHPTLCGRCDSNLHGDGEVRHFA
jgi:isoleucyl-tRNA synthetase